MITKEVHGTEKGFNHYIEPEYKTKPVNVRIYCSHKGCYTYIKGTLRYNGGFMTEDGEYCDLRNQMFVCSKHSNTTTSTYKLNKTLRR